MTSSRIGDVIDALVTMCRAAPALAGVSIADGPAVLVSEGSDGAAEQNVLYIGDSLDDEPSASAVQRNANLGNGSRDQDIVIVCTAESVSGDTDMKARRDKVLAIAAAVDQLTRRGVSGSDYTLGGIAWDTVALARETVRQRQAADGAIAELSFTVTVRCRF